ncbi:MAG: cob(I)yrinic acid a,c-diamide adenosyltransferase [Candidatus Omnitrophica bacterium]|nr:cob(I)yrinic acid a,c-diamide adenosyltransferase [Candidatus Omnitrophota bacterium]
MIKTKRIDKAPRKHIGLAKNVKKGLIILNTGNGKGKSTAAFGTAIRAIGSGYKVAIVQFIKGDWKTGEIEFLKSIPKQCQVYVMGDGFTWDTKNFTADVKTAQRAWKKCRAILHDKTHQLVIFDEIIYAINYNFLDLEIVITELKKKPIFKHVILTGGQAHKKLIAIADLVTEMKCIKHPYDRGIKAQKGIEY